MSFAPDPRIAAASAFVADLPLCQVRLQDDARWPWLVLLPRQPDLRELDALDRDDRYRLMDEITLAGDAVRGLGRVEKLNVAALGNVVPQLHVHVVGRHDADEAWPDPVWGRGVALRYAEAERERLVHVARRLLTT